MSPFPTPIKMPKHCTYLCYNPEGVCLYDIFLLHGLQYHTPINTVLILNKW